MNFELTTRDYHDYINLCDTLLFHPSIRSAIFEDGFKVNVHLDKHRLDEFAILIRKLEVEIKETRKTGFSRPR